MPRPRMRGITAGILIAVLPVLAVAFHKVLVGSPLKFTSDAVAAVVFPRESCVQDNRGSRRSNFGIGRPAGTSSDGEQLNQVARAMSKPLCTTNGARNPVKSFAQTNNRPCG